MTTAPPAPSCTGPVGISINNAATFATSTSVNLRIRPPAGATQVVLSNDGGFDTADVRATSSDCTYAWTLSSSGFRDAKSVYVRFVGGGVDELTTLADDIILDTAAPALKRPVIKNLKNSKKFKVKISARDSVSGVSKVRYAKKKGAKGKTVRNKGKAYKDQFRTRKPGAYRWVKVYDRAGNSSGWKKAVRRG